MDKYVSCRRRKTRAKNETTFLSLKDLSLWVLDFYCKDVQDRPASKRLHMDGLAEPQSTLQLRKQTKFNTRKYNPAETKDPGQQNQ